MGRGLAAITRALDRFFCIQARGSTIKSELLSGVVQFVGNVGNLVATASVLHVAGLPFEDGVVGGAWAGFFSQVCVGLLGNLPISVSAGPGPNFTVAYLLARPVAAGGVGSYQASLTVCMVSGLMVVALTLSGAITRVTTAVPDSLKSAICVGIGLLCSFVGFQQVGMVVRSDEGLIGPGDFTHSVQIWMTLAGIMMLTLLSAWQVKGGALITMVVLTLIDWGFVSHWPQMTLLPFRLPPLVMPAVAPLSSPGFWSEVVAMTLMLVFDSMGCIFGLGRLAKCTDPDSGEVIGGTGMFAAMGLSTTVAGLFGVSPIVVNPAAAVAILDGPRTGLSTCVSGLLFVLSIPFSQQLESMPTCVSAMLLIYMGVSFTADAAHIAWDKPIEAVPAFLCIVSQPFLFSIADGIYMGLASAIVLRLSTGGMEALKAMACRWRGTGRPQAAPAGEIC